MAGDVNLFFNDPHSTTTAEIEVRSGPLLQLQLAVGSLPEGGLASLVETLLLYCPEFVK